MLQIVVVVVDTIFFLLIALRFFFVFLLHDTFLNQFFPHMLILYDKLRFIEITILFFIKFDYSI